ncbi:MAG: 50S ribosomal protein L25 [Patescibacteria group bacterium]
MELTLLTQKREKNEKLDKDSLAAVVYGKGIESQSLKLKKADFEKVFAVAGESNLIKLDLGSSSVNVLVKDMHKDPIKGFFTHVDFYQVNMKEKITAEIPLHFIGESKAVKELGGMLNKEIHEIAVECLPSDLVDHIEIDISVLNTFEDEIRMTDLKLPKGLELVSETDDIIVMVMRPKLEEEEPAEVAPVVDPKAPVAPVAPATPAPKK